MIRRILHRRSSVATSRSSHTFAAHRAGRVEVFVQEVVIAIAALVSVPVGARLHALPTTTCALHARLHALQRQALHVGV